MTSKTDFLLCPLCGKKNIRLFFVINIEPIFAAAIAAWFLYPKAIGSPYITHQFKVKLFFEGNDMILFKKNKNRQLRGYLKGA